MVARESPEMCLSVGIVETLIGIGNKFFRIFMAGTCGHTFDLQSEQTIERVKVM